MLLGAVRRCVLRTLESRLGRGCPEAPLGSRCGAVTFVQRFGSALNAHTHLHCCVADRVFSLDADGTLRFHPAADLDDAALRAVQRRIRIRVLRIAVRYCARPVFASERLFWEGHDRPAALLPPPRRHRHHYFGVFAPHAALRARDPPDPALHFDQTLN